MDINLHILQLKDDYQYIKRVFHLQRKFFWRRIQRSFSYARTHPWSSSYLKRKVKKCDLYITKLFIVFYFWVSIKFNFVAGFISTKIQNKISRLRSLRKLLLTHGEQFRFQFTDNSIIIL